MFVKRVLQAVSILTLVGVLFACTSKPPQASPTPLPAAETTPSPAALPSPAATQQSKPTPSPTAVPTSAPVIPQSNKLVMIDPGHQRHGNNEPELVGPDTRETKPKVSSGTVGVRTKKPEYVLNLEVSLLKAELTRRGINVAMTRETYDVDISNKQRADMANEAGASLVVRIHADGDGSASTKGFSVLYPSAAQTAVKPIAAESKQEACKACISRSALVGFIFSISRIM